MTVNWNCVTPLLIASLAVAACDTAETECLTNADCEPDEICESTSNGSACRAAPASDGGFAEDAGVVDGGTAQIDGGTAAADAGSVDGGFSAEPFTIEGSTFANANLTVTVGTSTFAGTANTSGGYSVEVSPTDIDELVSITAEVPGDSPLAAAGLLDSVGKLIVAAGADRVLTATEEPATRLSGFTTIRYVAAVLLNEGSLPARASELDEVDIARAAFLVRRPTVYPDEALPFAAAVLEQIASSTASAGAPRQSLIDFALDWPRFRRFLSTQDRTPALAEAWANPRNFEPFDAGRVADVYTTYWPTADGFVGRSGEQILFQANGRGTVRPQREQELFTSRVPQDFAWSVNAAGEVVLAYDEFAGYDEFLSINAIRELYPDPADALLVINALTACGFGGSVRVRRQSISTIFRRSAGGDSVDLVLGEHTYRYRFDLVLQDLCQTTGPAAEVVELLAQTWVQRAAVPPVPWTAPEVVGRWVLGIATVPSEGSPTGRFTFGEVLIADHVVTFNADGTGEATSTLPAPSLSIQWAIEPDGRLRITSNLATQWVTRLTTAPGETQVQIEVTPETGPALFDINRAHRFAEAVTVTPERLQDDGRHYWQATLAIRSARSSDGEPLIEDVFGFRFRDAGQVETRTGEFVGNDPNDPTIDLDFGRTYVINDDVVRLERWVDENGDPCPPNSAPNCYLFRTRLWIPVAEDGDRISVYETLTLTADWPVQWNAGLQMYTNRFGQAVDPNRQTTFILPRLNSFYLRPTPPE